MCGRMRKLLPGTEVISAFYANKVSSTRQFAKLSAINLKSNQLFQKYIEMNSYYSMGYCSNIKNGTNAGSNADISFENKNLKTITTEEDLESLMSRLKEILKHRTENISSWIIERKVKTLCGLYKCLSKEHRGIFLQELAGGHAVDHQLIYQAAKILLETDSDCNLKHMKTEDQLRNLLTPHYLWLFLHIGKLEKGVKFLVDLRTDVLDLIAEKNSESNTVVELQKLNTTLRELLSMWFSVGFLELERVTWKSSCEMLQKVSEYEAVHPVRSWTDLKRRVGPYRRCFVFLHRSMPGEPVVVLHTALCDEISSTMKDIVSAQSRMTVEQSGAREDFINSVEDPRNVKAAVFYSISSTQRGLQGIELGNYLIKCVVGELQVEFPRVTQFSSLSPVPLFRSWLQERLKNAKRGHNDILFDKEIDTLKRKFNFEDVFEQLRRLLYTNAWFEDHSLSGFLEEPLMRLCARYLYLEKRRGYALDSVANFHLRNGAVMWRLNWNANLSPRGLSNSCGIMVNYRYFLEDTENNSIAYVEKQKISASDQVVLLAAESQKLMSTSKL